MKKPSKTEYMHVFVEYMRLLLVKMMNLSQNPSLSQQFLFDGLVEKRGGLQPEVLFGLQVQSILLVLCCR